MRTSNSNTFMQAELNSDQILNTTNSQPKIKRAKSNPCLSSLGISIPKYQNNLEKEYLQKLKDNGSGFVYESSDNWWFGLKSHHSSSMIVGACIIIPCAIFLYRTISR